MRRIAAVVLPRVRLELAKGAEEGLLDNGGLVAIVVARPGSAIKDERSLLGNTRLDEVSAEAYALGVRPGHTIAAARARAADLRVRVVHESAATAALARLAEALLAFGATTAFSGECRARASGERDVVWIDLTGCAHLFGGEEALAEQLAARVRALGHACRVGVADGPRIAAQIAWYAQKDVTLAPPGEGARAMRPLPVSALPVDVETMRWLRSSGLRRVGDVQALLDAPGGRRAVGVRLGERAAEVLALLDGDDRAPLAPYVPPSAPEEKLELEYGVDGHDAILFVVRRLTAQLAARLEGRAMGATRIELVFSLDRALLPEPDARGRASPRARGAEDARDTVAIAVPAPLARAAELFAVLRARLESFEVRAPILAVTLRAAELAPRAPVALDLFVPEARAERALPALVAELTADLGAGAVGTLALENRWSYDERASLVPLGARRPPPPRLGSLASPGAREPTRLLPRAKVLATAPRVTVTARLEAIEWWRHGALRKDYGEAWIENAGATAWVEMETDALTGTVAKVKGWLD